MWFTGFLANIWNSEPMPYKSPLLPRLNIPLHPNENQDELDDDDNEFGYAETYGDYMPSKLNYGMPHPDPVIETNSLYSVQPPDISYQLTIPAGIIDAGLLSALQLESIVYACQQHETILPNGQRAGFLIGDGAGVGKGRMLAGLIFENYMRGRDKAIWLSASKDLKFDSERDLKDIGAERIAVHSLTKFKYAKISSRENDYVKNGVIFCTYTSLISKSYYGSRIEQLLEWCGEDFDGLLIFDECHKAKNLCPSGSARPTQTGLRVLDLQNKLPKARVVYSSATGASEPNNMAYMTRLGLWGTGTNFKEFENFIITIKSRGIGAMELIAMDMKLRGIYMARQLSFSGVSFKIEEIPLSKEFKIIYNEAVQMWILARATFEEASNKMDTDYRNQNSMWCQFWATHQRFFKYLCIASKVEFAAKISREAVENGKCVVISLESTGEARTLEQLGEARGELTDFISTAKEVFESLIEKHFPKMRKIANFELLQQNNTLSGHDAVNDEYAKYISRCVEVDSMKDYLLLELRKLENKLPSNTLDQLICDLGGSDKVAEMTGRKGRIVTTEDGRVVYEPRTEAGLTLELLNVAEKQRFMNGNKRIAIISEAASSGISLHSDRRAINQAQRVHITLELPWSADKAVQQFGRTHRSNQVVPPEYIFLISDLAGERRFASVVAHRIEMLGALTHGDRRAGESRDLSSYNIYDKYATEALNNLAEAIMGKRRPIVPPPSDYPGNFFADVRQALIGVGLITENKQSTIQTLVEKDFLKLTRFLNRILGIVVDLQNLLFQYFSDTLEALIQKAKIAGTYDSGIIDLGLVERRKCIRFTKILSTTTTNIELHTVSFERGLSFSKAMDIYNQAEGEDIGFYLVKKPINNKLSIIMAITVSARSNKDSNDKNQLYHIYRPNTGLQTKKSTLKDIEIKYKKVDTEEAKEGWNYRYDISEKTCSHKYMYGVCRSSSTCEFGIRNRTYHILTGSVLSVWDKIFLTLRNVRFQVIRFSTEDNLRIIGTLISSTSVNRVVQNLIKELGNFNIVET